MSRLIIKNLPKKITADRLKSTFSSKGDVTDVQLKFNSKGTFRQFAFLGFKTEEQAQTAKEYFHETFIDSYKIKVETCENIGSTTVKTWSKHTKVPVNEELTEDTQKKKKKKKKKSRDDSTPDELKNDPKFLEFISLHKDKTSWADFGLLKSGSGNLSATSEKSDLVDDDSDFEDSEVKEKPLTKPVESANKRTGPLPVKKHSFEIDDSCTVKVKDLPQGCKKSQIKKFFAPLKIISLRLPHKIKGMAYVRFKTERDMKQALNKHRGFLEGSRISVRKFVPLQPQNSSKALTNSTLDSEADPLIETGRIFVRNLCYTSTEEEIENLFKSFGPITEVHLPLDTFSKKLKGFAFVTFMFPEHAVKAFSALDGSSFQGRTLHLLPAKSKKPMEENQENEGSSFKKKKASELKASSGSWHNWNTLFLGANAVADVMAEKYNTTKSKLLDAEQKSSVAVTIALGETQIVSETREFLVNQGVHLEAFQNPQVERSKTVILVKNLPANTKEQQIREVFSLHGEIKRLVLPPSGVTAIVEFQHSTESKLAFRKLAYSKFQHVPLYLEWAPVDALGKAKSSKLPQAPKEEPDADREKDTTENATDVKLEEKNENDEEDEPQVGTVLFIKNLNFDTREDALKAHFKSSGKLISATIAMKPDPKNPGHKLSMGYGFVQFKKKSSASKAIKELQRSELDGHNLELKISNRDTLVPQGQRKLRKADEQQSTKIMVRNIPFEASKKEIKEIFSVFGELKALRLPRKVTGEHRGFGFVDYLTRHDAKRAMESLGASTHVFGRRLVLEWAEADDNENLEVLRKKTARHYEHHHHQGPSHKRLKDSLPQDTDELSS